MDKSKAHGRKHGRRDRKSRRKEEKKAVITDERFAEVHTNPRFKKPYRNKSKVMVDSRFKQMFHDKHFGGASSGNVDKYGRKLEGEARAPGAHLKKFYRLPEEEDEDVKTTKREERLKRLGQLARGEIEAKDGSESESSSDVDEEVEDEVESEPEEQIPLGEASARIAVQNLDWDKLQALDILVLLSSFLPSTGAIRRVAVHKSKYGEERMAIEDRYGPQLDPNFTAQEASSGEASAEVKEGDEEEGEEKEESALADVDKAKLRKYEQQRLKYYFAVVEFDSAKTANHVYEECDGVEFEHSAVVFDLRFIPDDISIDTSIREEATSIPEDYKAPEFVTKALQSTNVELSWDGDDAKRDHLRKWGNSALKGKEIVEDKDLEAFIGSDSSSEEEGPADEISKAKAREKFRSLLQAATNDSSEEEEEEDDDDEKYENENESDEQGHKPPPNASRLPSQATNEPNESSKSQEPKGTAAVDKSVFNDPFFMNPSKHNRRAKLKQQKQKLREKREERAKSEAKSKAELELLLMDEHGKEGKSNDVTGFDYNTLVEGEKLLKKGKIKGRGKQKKRKLAALRVAEEDTFKVDAKDPRFESLYTNPDFSVDPTSSHYKDTRATRTLETERRKRREAQTK